MSTDYQLTERRASPRKTLSTDCVLRLGSVAIGGCIIKDIGFQGAQVQLPEKVRVPLGATVTCKFVCQSGYTARKMSIDSVVLRTKSRNIVLGFTKLAPQEYNHLLGLVSEQDNRKAEARMAEVLPFTSTEYREQE
ncbi:MAG: hypothetical protein BMS9Abin36_1056 [Gammaproteobacteria bacterium]|nr:MAG: hypothetical protein BMS9Abin36_1056 [Gammaproteobacteria bacterium]